MRSQLQTTQNDLWQAARLLFETGYVSTRHSAVDIYGQWVHPHSSVARFFSPVGAIDRVTIGDQERFRLAVAAANAYVINTPPHYADCEHFAQRTKSCGSCIYMLYQAAERLALQSSLDG